MERQQHGFKSINNHLSIKKKWRNSKKRGKKHSTKVTHESGFFRHNGFEVSAFSDTRKKEKFHDTDSNYNFLIFQKIRFIVINREVSSVHQLEYRWKTDSKLQWKKDNELFIDLPWMLHVTYRNKQFTSTFLRSKTAF